MAVWFIVNWDIFTVLGVFVLWNIEILKEEMSTWSASVHLHCFVKPEYDGMKCSRMRRGNEKWCTNIIVVVATGSRLPGGFYVEPIWRSGAGRVWVPGDISVWEGRHPIPVLAGLQLTGGAAAQITPREIPEHQNTRTPEHQYTRTECPQLLCDDVLQNV